MPTSFGSSKKTREFQKNIYFCFIDYAKAFDCVLLLLLLSHFSRVQLCATPQTAVTSLPHPWDSPGKNTGVGCHFLHQCMKVKSESEVAQSCPTLSDPMDCSLPGSSIHGTFQARVLEWGAIAFSDCMDHDKLWKILKELEIPDHLTCLLRNLYAGQEARVRSEHGASDCFKIGKGVRQGCIFSPCLFNLYAEYIM